MCFYAAVIFEHLKKIQKCHFEFDFDNFRQFYRFFYFFLYFAIFVAIKNFSNLMNVFKFTNKSMGSVVPTLKNFKLVDTSGKRFENW